MLLGYYPYLLHCEPLGVRIKGTRGDNRPSQEGPLSQSQKWGFKKGPHLRGLPDTSYRNLPELPTHASSPKDWFCQPTGPPSHIAAEHGRTSIMWISD